MQHHQVLHAHTLMVGDGRRGNGCRVALSHADGHCIQLVTPISRPWHRLTWGRSMQPPPMYHRHHGIDGGHMQHHQVLHAHTLMVGDGRRGNGCRVALGHADGHCIQLVTPISRPWHRLTWGRSMQPPPTYATIRLMWCPHATPPSATRSHVDGRRWAPWQWLSSGSQPC